MATISGATNEKVYSIPKWLGLNEHPDGDTRLKLGEASKMVNWKITRDGNLKRRQGTEFIAGLCENYVVRVSPDIALLLEDGKAEDIIPVYPEATAMQVPGRIVLYGGDGTVTNGTYSGIDVSIQNGVMIAGETATMTVANGVLSIAGGGTAATFPELLELLQGLEEGEVVYTYFSGAPYALDRTSCELAATGYRLSGYRVDAVPDVETDQPIAGMWAGMAGGEKNFLAACNNGIWRLYRQANGSFVREFLEEVRTDKGVSFVPFDNKVYIINGYEYYVYDGVIVEQVAGYVPLVAISIGPTASADAGELTSEYVNLLINRRRVWLSPDGNTNKTFKLPEKAKSIVSVKYLDGSTAPTYTFTANTDTITFTSTLVAAVNSIEVEYAVKTHSDDASIPDYRSQVTSNLFAEIFSGGTDSALFFYGNGTNKAYYTGMDYDGMPRADYFPDQYEVIVGDSNTPITAMIRHYSALICFKTDSTWALNYGTTELATGDLTTAVYVTPVNRDKGNDAPGQVRLVDNSPISCSGSELYRWSSVSRYSSGISSDERNAKRISDRVQRSIKEIDFKNCCMWDDNDGQEFYISGDGITLVWNYAVDAWYRYEGLNAVEMCNFMGEVFFGTPDGKVLRLSNYVEGDENFPIKAEWESGSMDFGASNMRKYSSMMWIGMKPTKGSSVNVCVVTDRKNAFREKIVSADKAKIPGQPFSVRSKIKAKKFVFYKLQLSVDGLIPAPTITNVDFRVRQTGYSK